MKKILCSCFLLLFVLACSKQDAPVPSSGDPTVDLFKAVSAGDVDAIKKAVARGANVNATCNINIKTNTNECFWNGHKNECLVGGYSDFPDSMVFEEYFTPLFIAAKKNQPKVVQALLDEGANVKLPSAACRLHCDGDCVPFIVGIDAYSETFLSTYHFVSTDDSVTDATLQTALVFAQNGVFEKITPNYLIENEKISDRVLSDFLKQMIQLDAIEGLNEVDIVDDKPMSLSDQAYSENKPLTAKLLKSHGVKRISHFEIVESCDNGGNSNIDNGDGSGIDNGNDGDVDNSNDSDVDEECTEQCWGAIWMVRYDDGSEEKLNKCECGGCETLE